MMLVVFALGMTVGTVVVEYLMRQDEVKPGDPVNKYEIEARASIAEAWSKL